MSNIKVIAERSDIVAIADAVRTKTGTSNEMTLGQIAININNISGTEDLSTELTEQDSLLTELAGVLANKASGSSGGEQATPEISVSSSGLITATAGTKSATKQLTTQSAKTITPTTSSQTAVVSGRYTTGAVTVAAIPSNYEDVTTETTTYTNELANLESQISALEDALEGKTSGGSDGGSEVKTCTVKVFNHNFHSEIAYTTIENGKIKSKYARTTSDTEFIELEVLCGSTLVHQCDDLAGCTGYATSGVSFECQFEFSPTFVYTVYSSGSADVE